MQNLTIRPMEQKDIAPIKTIIKNIWEWDSLAETEDVLEAVIAIYFNPVLHEATFGAVAELNGKVVGVIFGTIKNDTKQYKPLAEELSVHALTLAGASDVDRASIREYFLKERKAYQDLINDCAGDYDAVLEFLILDDSAQGLGIGKKLWLNLKEYFKDKAVKRIYLYTDNESNYAFYESQGFTRRKALNVVYNFNGEIWENLTYLYEYSLKETLIKKTLIK